MIQSTVSFRLASLKDVAALAPLNALLIRDTGHRNPMNEAQLAERITGWLEGDYHALVFEREDEIIGYALYRFEPEFVYLRQLFVRREFRRRGIARGALDWLKANAWRGSSRVRIDVLVGNESGQALWRALGFNDYCITMERAL